VLAFFFWRIVKSTVQQQDYDDDSEVEADPIFTGEVRRRSARLRAKSEMCKS
jgi:hypothetical protein